MSTPKTLEQWHAWGPELDRIYQEELGRSVYDDPIGFTDWTFHWREEDWTGEQVRQAIRTHDEWITKHPAAQKPPQTPPSGNWPVGNRIILVSDHGPFHPRMYSYWSNAWIASNTTVWIFAGHVDGRARFFLVDPRDGDAQEANVSVSFGGTTEGWSWDSGGRIYLCDGPRLLRVNPFTGDEQVVLDISSTFGGCRLWQSHSTDDGRSHCATVEQPTNDGPYRRLGTVAVRDGRISFYEATGDLDESQVTEQWLIIKETRALKLDNRVINLDTGADYWLLDENGAVGHSDCDGGVLVGEDDYKGECILRSLHERSWLPLFSTWNMGHISLRRSVCLRSDHEHGQLQRVALDGSGLTIVHQHGVVTNDYDRQVRANLDPTGRVACYMANGAIYLLVL